ncbi:hypothetical protein PHYSODRAFT_334123 [Phytophthora sojae]|uniref:Uncharacterized protein n=1 Tax=Phytophthora sojae (strain P6497) TaxID=1094619 RepID=G4ZKI1_PHYSP|nr:hypothetical protein PHYSODRAFT_334123 [Phytophthora sojae]EGZ15923.1 hypothetical protein PHYSODRAFT_334123 [Phytophthora sojae]|eukprot:XP_009529672.1 hypothetical protein PHYSODRAFT_334123 [Phytophthora sojae]
MDQAADDAPRAAPPFPSASGDLVLAAVSLDIPASDVALAQTVYATPDARTSSLALPHSETPSQLFALGVVAASARNQDSHRRVGNQKKKANTGETSIATKQPSFAWTTAAADALLRARFDTAATFFSKLCCRTLAAANRTP